MSTRSDALEREGLAPHEDEWVVEVDHAKDLEIRTSDLKPINLTFYWRRYDGELVEERFEGKYSLAGFLHYYLLGMQNYRLIVAPKG